MNDEDLLISLELMEKNDTVCKIAILLFVNTV